MFRLAFFVAFGILAQALLASTSVAEKPNFVVIFIDDMGYGDIGPYGSELNRTPHLDRMADEGLKLTSFYAAPVCSASRAQLLTGCYAPRVGVPGVFFPAGPKGLNPDEHTIAEYLREQGYATTCIGKWHLGDQPEFLPTNHGFDHYFGIPYSNDMQRVSAESGKRVTPLLRDDKVAELLEDEGQRRVTREYTEEAVKFIKANRDQPFFLYLPHTAMHVPLFPHEDFVGKSNNGVYGDWVEEVDWSAGQVLDTLREQQLDRKTLVIFTSDNGPWASKGKAGGVAGPLRGSKGCTLEGGVREPTICWWPGTIKSGSESTEIVGTTDILPTLVSLAGGRTREDKKIDGEDISELLLGEATESPRKVWHYFQGTQLKAVRSGPWKLALGPQSIGMGMKEKPADLQVKSVRLYNLQEEVGEITNVADENPDVVSRLQKIANDMIADIGSGKPGPGVRPAGSVENPVTLYPTEPKSKARPKKGSVTRNARPIVWEKVKKGDAFGSDAVPNIAGKAFNLSCVVTSVEDRAADGVILAHGGSAIGYSLYADGGRIVFAIRESSDKISRIESPVPDADRLTINASVNKKGMARLRINEEDAVSIELGGTLPKHPQEDFCIGHDNRNPVDPKSPEQGFAGTIAEVRVVISD